MSDYLWDKTGAADPELERLENLLGGLAHRPRPLELPAAEVRRARRTPLLRYAAAAVLLAVLAGALVALRFAEQKDAGTVAEAPARTPEPREATPVETPRPPDLAAAPPDEAASRERQPRPAAKRSKRARRAVTSVGAPSAPEVAEAGERLRAKEQLVYALRLTGVKLEEVRRKVQGEEDAEEAPAGRSRTR